MVDSHPTSDVVRLHEQCSAACAELYQRLEQISPFATAPTPHNVAVFRQVWSNLGAAEAALHQLLP